MMLCHWLLKRSPKQCLGQPRRISRLRCRVQDDGAEKALPGIGPGLCRRPKYQPVGASQVQPIPAPSGWMAGQPWQGLGHFEGRIHICSRRKTFHVQFHNPAAARIVSKKFRPWKSGRVSARQVAAKTDAPDLPASCNQLISRHDKESHFVTK